VLISGKTDSEFIEPISADKKEDENILNFLSFSSSMPNTTSDDQKEQEED
jgi:hypothetical protein